jgi:phosphatidylserine synthase
MGVLADDAADAVSYAVAPAVAVAVTTSGPEGTAIGLLFGALTIVRLVFFTLKKDAPDTNPAVFRGLPSTVGGIVALAAAILWPQSPELVGFAAGAAVVFMVSFDAAFAHPGRLLQTLPMEARLRLGVTAVAVAAVAVALGPTVLATMCLACATAYAAVPVTTQMTAAVSAWAARKHIDA